MESISPASLATTRADVTPSRRFSKASMSSAKTSLGTTHSTNLRDACLGTSLINFSSPAPYDTSPMELWPVRPRTLSQGPRDRRLELGQRRRSANRPVDQHALPAHGRLRQAVDQDPHLRRLWELGRGVDKLPKPAQHTRAPA